MSSSHNVLFPSMSHAVPALSEDARRLFRSLNQPLPDPVPFPVLVVVSGLPGTGKSFFSQRLAERVSLAVLESDALRKVLSPYPLHTAEESIRLFRAIDELLDLLLERHLPVLLDATNLLEAHREALHSLAQRHKARTILVLVKAPPKVVRQRLEARRGNRDTQNHSDADWEVYQRMRPLQEPIRRGHIVVDTSRDIEPVLERVAQEIVGWTRLGR